ncbi:MAG: 6-phosphogluconolactonase [Spirochaetales bacterium]
MRKETCGLMTVIRGQSTPDMARLAAEAFARSVSELLVDHDSLPVVFSGAQSQMEFHAALRQRSDIPWNRLDAFAVDEFYAPGIPRHLRVCAQPERDLYSQLPFRSVNVLEADPPDLEAERRRYEALIRANPPRLACLGIGLSGHLALNEPGADPHDRQAVRLVEVCEASKRQLEQDPNFAALGSIPSQGLTLTLPVLLAAKTLLVVVPYALKRPVVEQLFATEVTPELPATLLRTHPDATLFLDPDSAPLGSPL